MLFMKILRLFNFSLLCILSLSIPACLTYYEQNLQFYRNYEQGNFEAAQKTLAKDEKGANGKAKLLYYLNLGLVHYKLGNYEQSNQYFEEAYLFAEDHRKNYLNEILAYFTNPMIVQYQGEDFELLLLHYYKALNFLAMGQRDKALVECRRLNIKLNAFADKYKSDRKYQRDAFIHTLMGIVYEASGDVNNAFIAYRNAVEIYQQDYQEMFGLDVPEQLKKDLLRSAALMGFDEQLAFYEKEFDMKFQPRPAGQGDLVFLWHNGFGPIKEEWSINFAINRRGSDVFFVNSRLGLDFSFSLPLRKDEDGNRFDPLGGLSVIRVAFPRYVERPEYFRSATLQAQNQQKPLYLMENLQEVAKKTLRDRMVLELSKALLRLAIKRAEEEILRSKDQEGLAALVSIINAATERADTRAWQAIPHSIYYTRLSLPAGSQQVQLQAQAPGGTRNFDFNFDIAAGDTEIHSFHTMEVDPSFRRNYNY